MTEAHFRLARRSDAKQLGSIRRQAILVLASSEIGEERAANWANSASAERVIRAIEDHEVWVAGQAGVAVGWVEIDGERIEAMYVHPDVSLQGVGSRLLAHAERRVCELGHASIQLDASPNAEGFYLRNGYEPRAARRPDAARPMSKQLHASMPTRD